MNKYLLRLVAIVILPILAVSCSVKRNLAYFSDIPADSAEGVIGESSFAIKIVPADELYITVNSQEPKATADYNLPLSNPAKSATLPNANATPTQQTFIVDHAGDINFPVLGKIKVEGMTTAQLAQYLTDKISEQVVDPVVRVQLINFKVNVLGEVKNPSTVKVESERFSIFDALAAAGDLTEYGNRESVIVMREEGGKKLYHRLNLRDSKIVTSPYFYLQQNDVVYVEPNSIREANSKYNQNNAFKLSVISAVVSAVSVVTTLVIAIVLK